MSQPNNEQDEPPLTDKERQLLEYLGAKSLPPDAVTPPEDKRLPVDEKILPEDAPLIDEYGDLVEEDPAAPRAGAGSPPPAKPTQTPPEPPPPPDPPPTTVATQAPTADAPGASQGPPADPPTPPDQQPRAGSDKTAPVIKPIQPRPNPGVSSADRPFQGGRPKGGDADEPAEKTPWRPNWLVIGGGTVAALVLILFGFMLSRMPGPQVALAPTATTAPDLPTAATPVVVATPAPSTPEPAPTLETPTVELSPTVATPTPVTPTAGTATPQANATEVIRANFAKGLEFYADKDWLNATRAFSEVFVLNPDYESLPPIRDALSASLYNLSITQIDETKNPTPAQVQNIRDQFQRVVSIIAEAQTTSDELRATFADRSERAVEWVAILGRYLDGRTAIEQEDWEQAITALESVPLSRDENGNSISVLDVVNQRIAAYRGQGDQLASEGNFVEANMWYQDARAFAEANGGNVAPLETAIARLPAPTPTATRVPTPTQTPMLRFVVANYNDDPACISVGIRGIGTSGWYFSVDGKTWLRGNFDGAGNARICGLGSKEEVTITVFNASGRAVSGGRGVPSRGSAIMVATWR